MDRESQKYDPNKNHTIVYESGCLLKRNDSFAAFDESVHVRELWNHLLPRRYSLGVFQTTFPAQI